MFPISSPNMLLMSGLSGVVVLKLYHAPESSVRLVKTQIAEPHPRVSDSVEQGWGPRFCISNKYSGDVGGPGSTLCKPLAHCAFL